MKLYHFNPNDYGQEYFVMSKSIEDAKDSLVNYLFNLKNQSPFTYIDEYELWVNDFKNGVLPKGYTVDIYEANEIIQSEIC